MEGKAVAHLALALLGPFQATLDGTAGRRPEFRSSARAVGLPGRRAWAGAPPRAAWPLCCGRSGPTGRRSAHCATPCPISTPPWAIAGRPAPFLLVTRTSVQFNAASDHWLDVAEFEDLTGRQDVPGLERAASLYRGPFLDGLSVRDSPAFDDWMLLKGEEYRRSVLARAGASDLSPARARRNRSRPRAGRGGSSSWSRTGSRRTGS